MVSFNDFKKMDIRVAEIKDVKDHPDADKLYVVEINIGTETKSIVAGVKNHYKPDELIGKKVIVLANMEPATIRGVESSAMILAAKDGDALSVLITEKDLPVGSKIS